MCNIWAFNSIHLSQLKKLCTLMVWWNGLGFSLQHVAYLAAAEWKKQDWRCWLSCYFHFFSARLFYRGWRNLLIVWQWKSDTTKLSGAKLESHTEWKALLVYIAMGFSLLKMKALLRVRITYWKEWVNFCKKILVNLLPSENFWEISLWSVF